MDFQFTSSGGEISLKCSMEHQAVAHWFNTEVRLNPALIESVLKSILQVRNSPAYQDIRLCGAEYSLYINAQEIMIRANNLDLEAPAQQLLEPDFHYYDEESLAFCGLEDFEALISAYLNFNL
ncbi:hypothetical protein EDC45_1535 [Mesocricetibacter intestinalis]|uniref:Uncharacterized protein n=1 Tax=Mesocricetibacter intestinalis TaxID=1521930 RepID=A0A4R6V7D8_9PAST|nr:YacL family protein [Mesocricetibacter intestinalis]TDQ57142.1 hypothetical protein EDC45_1535 [Mesocricetibacter intestinalis]